MTMGLLGLSLDIASLLFKWFPSPVRWLLERRWPCTPKHKAGIVIAIRPEDDQARNRLKNDLIAELQDNIERNSQFVVLVLPDRLAETVTEKKSQWVLTKTRSIFIMYGSLGLRQNGEYYLLISKARVRHREVGDEVKQQLGKEFNTVFPAQYEILTKDEIRDFELTRNKMNVGARYMVGVAAMVSGDLGFAYNTFLYLWADLERPQFKGDRYVKEYLHPKIEEIALEGGRYLYWKYLLSNDEEFLEKGKRWLERAPAFSSKNYAFLTIRAIYLFFDGEVERAKDTIKQAGKLKRNKDNTWMYSLGFLYAYERNMAEAEQQYAKAKRTQGHDSIPLQTEIFMRNLLEKEKDKWQLWYWLGWINFHVKNDYLQARRDFEAFLSYKYDAQYVTFMEKSKIYLEKIKRRES